MKRNNLSYNKYLNKFTEVDGIKFSSKKEAKRYSELKIMENAGIISDLKLQVKFVLIPAQYEESSEMPKLGSNRGVQDKEFTCTKKNKKIGCTKRKSRCVERECCYIADFTYLDENNNFIVEDTKGMRTDVYKIKRKLMLYVHGIKIIEI